MKSALPTARRSTPERLAAKIGQLCTALEARADEPWTLASMSREAHVSPFHLQRRFKALLGVTPRQYLERCRTRALKAQLRGGASVTQAIFDAGFGSTSRVYERVDTQLGMTPRQYRRGGAGVSISYASAPTPLGLVMMAASDRGLCFVQFGDSAEELQEQLAREFPRAALQPMPPQAAGEFDRWMQALSSHLADLRRPLQLPLDLHGTAFQLRVWTYLQRIPSGEVRSYGEVARALGQASAVRAVARACAANRVAILVPCHRVIRGDGGLGGYRWGLPRKRTLLDLERAARAGSG